MEEDKDKYQLFLHWFTANGGKYCDLQYPTKFPPTDYIGVSTAKDINRNKVVMAIPKKLIIGVDMVKQSQIGFLFEEYQCFKGQDSDDRDFNMLTLFLIMEKMKGKQSFYHPYLQIIEVAETMIHWSNQQIIALDDPYLNLPFLEQARKQFEPTMLTFQQIVTKNKKIFPQPLTKQLFYQCYGIVMTRCFGWGLPQTMIVPFADCMNHASEGVHHYTFSHQLQGQKNKQYIKKMKNVDLSVFGIDNHQLLPIGYEKDEREKYIQANQVILEKVGIPLKDDVRKLSKKEFEHKLNTIRAVKINSTFDTKILPSSQSQDNDTDSNSSQEEHQEWGVEGIRYYRTRKFLQQLFQMVQNNKEEQFSMPKPLINRQFQDDVSFKWWYDTSDAHFIVATSKPMEKGEQIFNSYGRRNNRFLLMWYGFTFDENKYDSLPFRIWAERIEQYTGQMLFTRYITDVDWKNQISIGNERYPYTYLSPQFRLKKTEINYCLLAFLRFRVVKGEKKFSKLRDKYTQLHKIVDLQVEERVLEIYKKILVQLIKRYGLAKDKDFSCMNKQRRLYASILTESNSNIVSQHCLGVELMQRILQVMRVSKKVELLEIYRSKWVENETEIVHDKIANRIFLRHYFKMLDQFKRSK